MNEVNHFEVMEELGQINMFELIESTSDESKSVVQLQVGDKVQCNVTEDDDFEAYNYLKYYKPSALNNTGEIQKIDGNVLTVIFKTEFVLLNLHQVSL